LYGTQQACRTFTQGLATFLTLSDYQRLPSEACNYLFRDHTYPTQFILLTITVDDFLVATNYTPSSLKPSKSSNPNTQ